MFNHGKLITILQYFTDKVDDYWHILYPIVSKEQRDKDKYLYFYDISRKAIDYDGEFSNDGIYMFLGYDGEYHIHALEIAQYSLACWLAWQKTKDNKWMHKALHHCNWLVNNQENDGAWRIEHKNPNYKDLPTPWPSALAQGLAISSSVRAYFYTQDEKYLECAKKACKFLEVDVSNNGVKRKFEKNNIRGFIYEEYPRKNLNGVLNGYISAILGVFELSEIDYSYKSLFYKNINNLINILPLYDIGYWSYYSLDNNIASGFYHRLVVKQLKILSEFDDKFNEFYLKFFNYQNNKIYAFRAFINKVKAKI